LATGEIAQRFLLEQAGCGQEDALAAMEETVRICRQFDKTDPNLLDALSIALSDLGVMLAKRGRRDEAMAVTKGGPHLLPPVG